MNVLLLLLAVAVIASGASRLSYPEARRSGQTDTYFGEKVADPYRWLEDVDSPETRAWVAAENRVTFGYLDTIPQREPVRRIVARLFEFERYLGAFQVNGRYFYYRNDGHQNQNVLYTQAGPEGQAEVLLDPNRLSADGTVAIGEVAVDRAARYLAYSTASSGSDWNIWHIRQIATGEDLPDRIEWSKFGGISWTPDGGGFYYVRFPEPKEGNNLINANYNHKVYFHKVGDPQANDRLVYERPDHRDWLFGSDVTDDGHDLILRMTAGASNNNGLYYQDLTQPGSAVLPLVERLDAQFTALGNVGSTLYVFTTDRAERGRIIAIDLTRPEAANWREIVGEKAETLQEASLAGGQLVLSYMKDAHSLARAHGLDGRLLHEIRLPGIGHVTWAQSRQKDTELFYSYVDFTTPPSVYRYEIASGKSALFRASQLSFDPAKYETEQVFYPSKDGTKVPMYLVHKKGLKRDGQNPTLLYGYGGFNIPLQPNFSVGVIAWLEMGGVYASANLRGGSEYGEAWHKAGTKLQKQNVFDDFIAGAEYLIQTRVTSTPKLAILGRSNGGLLVGAVLNQRPELFGAAFPGVGVMDMLRFQKFTIGRAWTEDYGSSDHEEEFRAIRAYSPLHNVKQGAKYPPTFIVTADHDDRVVPGHSFKYAAAMQHAQGGEAPVLIRIETKAGHGGGKPVSKQIEELTDEYAFAAKALGMEVK